MATVTVRIHLEGGPCNGTNHTVKRTGDLLPGFTCKGTDYQPTTRKTSSGRVIYTTKKSQQKPPKKHTSGPTALGGWTALRKSINKGMPQTLAYSQRVNAQTLRTLNRARRVKV